MHLGPLKKMENDDMGKSMHGGSSGPYRESTKLVKAIICMVGGEEFEYSVREIKNNFDAEYMDYMMECHSMLNSKIIRLKKALLMTDHVKYIRFEISSGEF